MKPIFLFSILIFSFITHLQAQIADYGFPAYLEYAMTPYAINRTYGIGNLGFDDPKLIFNTKYPEKKYVASFSLLGDYNVYYQAKSDNLKIYEGKFEDYYDFTINLKYKNYLFHISNYQSLALRSKSLRGITSIYSTRFGKLDYSLSNRILQLSIVKKFVESLSLSLGVLTNQYEYKMGGNSTEKFFNIKTNYFNQLQLKSSINYSYRSNLDLYFLIKTQNSDVKVYPEEYNISYYPGYDVPNRSILSYPGLIAYGIKHQISDSLYFSLELLHDFLFVNKNIKINGEITNFNHEIFNSQVSLGSKFRISKELYFGVNYLFYLKYDIKLNSFRTTPPYSSYKIKHPMEFIVSISYSLNSISLMCYYKYSSAVLQGYYPEFYLDLKEKHSNHNLSIGISYDFK